MLNDTQLRVYRSHRAQGRSVPTALHLTRLPVTNPNLGKRRPYVSGHAGRNDDTRIQYWDHKDSVPFRFIGYVDEIRRSIDHQGWYCDQFQDRTLRGVVYQLPARNGVPQYLSGYQESDNDSVVLYLDSFEAEPAEAAYRADRIAERWAESEREYQEAWFAGSQAGEAVREALDALRDEVSRIVQIALYPDRIGLTVDDDASADRQHEEARDKLVSAISAARDSQPTYSKDLLAAWREGFDGSTTIKAIGGGIRI
ncbi:hypothetical protein UFOVP786_23 [uncultured Caudovirales phage]|uniref:Uncharacterized protein n=1 Tax=uncultured Caudovirales phage TaxID=2100421 RepID=A0A6J5NQL6_9CAUD|nr:hypothetical protein UFOVP786_23 [uncultured Caudovirales phage]